MGPEEELDHLALYLDRRSVRSHGLNPQMKWHFLIETEESGSAMQGNL